MNTLPDKELAHYVTMRVGGMANEIVEANTEQDVIEACQYAKANNLPVITMGWGSNIIFNDDGFNGLVIINKISGLHIDEAAAIIEAGAGEITDKIVEASVSASLVGIEALSKIPGVIGAAPVNNIGAYGQEIKDTLVKIRTYDTQTSKFIELNKNQCGFSYRESIFKSKEHGRYVITKIWLQLKKAGDNYQAPNYPSLLTELQKQGIAKPTPAQVRQAIISLRSGKLPDTRQLPNSGSFFKNPNVSQAQTQQLLATFPDMPHYPQTDGREKLSAAWLIDTAGLKGYRQDGFWVYDQQPLVLINEKQGDFNGLIAICNHVTATVKNRFDVDLETEPEIINE
jgi:UDP-N-acetylmuramate dehydrogenase